MTIDIKTDHLNSAVNAARQTELLLEDILSWMSRTEDTLAHAAQHPIPNDLDAIEGLLTEHEELEDEMTARQLDMERLLSGPQFLSTSQRSRYRANSQTGGASRASSTDAQSQIPDAIANKLVDKKGRRTKIPISDKYKSKCVEFLDSTIFVNEFLNWKFAIQVSEISKCQLLFAR